MSESKEPHVEFKDCPGAVSGEVKHENCDVHYGNVYAKPSYDAFVDHICEPGSKFARHFLGGTIVLIGSLALLMMLQKAYMNVWWWWACATLGILLLTFLTGYGLYRSVGGVLGGWILSYRSTSLCSVEAKLNSALIRSIKKILERT